jgi:hypothetical protein
MARAEIGFGSIEKFVSPKNQRKLGQWIRNHIELRAGRKRT